MEEEKMRGVLDHHLSCCALAGASCKNNEVTGIDSFGEIGEIEASPARTTKTTKPLFHWTEGKIIH